MHPRPSTDHEACAVCKGRPSGPHTLAVFDQTVFVDIVLCSPCVSTLTGDAWIRIVELDEPMPISE